MVLRALSEWKEHQLAWNDGLRSTPVCTENLNTGVAVMKSAQDGAWPDHTGSLNQARNRRRPRDRGARASLGVTDHDAVVLGYQMREPC
jgi:hypothetical protein